MSNDDQVSPKDVEDLIRDLGKPLPAPMKERILEAVREIDIEMEQGTIPVPTKVPEIEKSKDSPSGRDGIDD